MTWLPLVVALVALLGVILTNVVAWRNNRALDAKWRAELVALEGRTDRALESDERKDRRAKAVDLYKWAADRALSDSHKIAQSGVDALTALLDSDLLDDEMKPLVAAALSSSYADEIRAIEADAEDVEVIQLTLEALPVLDVAFDLDAGDDLEPDEQAEEGT